MHCIFVWWVYRCQHAMSGRYNIWEMGQMGCLPS